MEHQDGVEVGRKVIITGGAGFIGSRLALALIDRGYDVTVLDNLSPQIHGPEPQNSYTFQLIKDKVRFIHADVCSREIVVDALSGQNIVVHLAAETGTGQSMYEMERYTKVNIDGTAIILESISQYHDSVKKLIVASSRSIYGEGKYNCKNCGDVHPTGRSDHDMSSGNFEPRCPKCGSFVITPLATDECSLISPGSLYAITKNTQEQMVLLAGRMLGISAIALRYQNVYGPGQSLNNPYTGILSIFSKLLLEGKQINIFEDGMESRDFVYIDDVVDATIKAIEHPDVAQAAFNVGSGVATTVSKVANLLKELYCSSSEIVVSGRYRVGDIRHNFACMDLIGSMLSYAPSIDFENGVRSFCEWVKKQELMESNAYLKSMDELASRGLYK